MMKEDEMMKRKWNNVKMANNDERKKMIMMMKIMKIMKIINDDEENEIMKIMK